MRTHLISGATSGIGRAIADRLIAAGDAVIPILRDDRQRNLFPNVSEAVIADFEDPRSVGTAVAKLPTPVDSFINCAGIMISKTLFEASFEELARMVNVHLLSTMAAVASVRPHLNVGGVIVLLSSQSAFKGSYDDAYAITKGAIHAMVKTLALKLAPRAEDRLHSPGRHDWHEDDRWPARGGARAIPPGHPPEAVRHAQRDRRLRPVRPLVRRRVDDRLHDRPEWRKRATLTSAA